MTAADSPLIPFPTTDVDRRVNAAFERAVRRDRVQWVWLHPDLDTLLITDQRPATGVAIAVSPARWALVVAEGAEVPWKEDAHEPD